MTEQEAIEQFKEHLAIEEYRQQIPKYYEAMELAVKSLEEIQQYRAIGTVKEVMELKEQNMALRNRCKIFTKGQLCIFCPIRCEERAEEYRNAEGSGEE